MANDENGTASSPSDVTASSFLEALYDDPLRVETARTGRYLVIASAIDTMVALFNVRLQSTNVVSFDFGGRTDVLAMLISLSAMLLLANFVLRASTDLLRDREAALLVTRYIESERVAAALKAARATDRAEAEAEQEYREGPSPDPDPWWETYGNITEKADAAVSTAEAKIGIRRLPRAVRRVRIVLEIAVPVVFAVVALVLSRASLATFATALVSALNPWQ